MRFALLLIVFATPCIAANGESPKVLAELLRVYHQLTLEAARDESRNEESPFLENDITNATPDECTAFANMMRRLIADVRAEMSRPYVGLTDSERIEAYGRLQTLKFPEAPEIDDITKKCIVAAIVAQPSIDPRILSMSYVDKHTVKLIAGARCSTWCAYGLHCYIARLEGDRWIIRPADLVTVIR